MTPMKCPRDRVVLGALSSFASAPPRTLHRMPLVTPPPPDRVRILNGHPVPRFWEYRPRLRVRARVEWETGVEHPITTADRYSRTGLVFVHLPDRRCATWGAWLAVEDVEVLDE